MIKLCTNYFLGCPNYYKKKYYSELFKAKQEERKKGILIDMAVPVDKNIIIEENEKVNFIYIFKKVIDH
ncbi:hypothetical protein BpHYR1_050700 [Brachionus plicatilis]|uniref:Uncharacterized protein n=1 Tax=Brachionus plicatilis TaxID=10195 RepID=A0A3M7P3F8_BRAPC|nr:hypothetical protein BpHYR1_050700 [Brachionus plicatilis]